MWRLRCQKKTKETTFCQNTSFNHRWEVSPSELFQTLCWRRWSLRITTFQRMGERKGICKCIVQYQTHLSLPILMFCQKKKLFPASVVLGKFAQWAVSAVTRAEQQPLSGSGFWLSFAHICERTMISAEWIECFRHEEFLILVMQMMSCAVLVFDQGMKVPFCG